MREMRYLDKLIDELAKGKANGEDLCGSQYKGRMVFVDPSSSDVFANTQWEEPINKGVRRV